MIRKYTTAEELSYYYRKKNRKKRDEQITPLPQQDLVYIQDFYINESGKKVYITTGGSLLPNRWASWGDSDDLSDTRDGS